MSVLTGSRQIWAYVFEDDGEYAQEPGEPADNDFKPFGDDEDISEPDADNSEESLYRPFSRQPSTYLEQEYDGSWGVDFVYTNPWWFAFIFGEPEIVEETGEWTLTFEGGPQNLPKSGHLIEETHYRDGTVTQTVYIGAVVDSPDVSTSVQDTFDVSLDGFYADERLYEDAANSPYGEIGQQPTTDFRPLNFANAELFLDLDDDGTAEFRGNVQDADISFNSNADPEYELGTRFSTAPSFLDFEPDLTYTARVTDDLKEEEKKSFYGTQVDTSGDELFPAEELTDDDIIGSLNAFSRKQTNELEISFAEAFPSSYQRSNTGDPESAVDDDVDRMLTDMTVEAVVDVEPRF